MGLSAVSGVDQAEGVSTPHFRTAPYMHDGSIATLKEVVEFYNDGETLIPIKASICFR